MARVKLGDVAREYKATIKDTADLPIVGLEHLTPGEITLERWDVGTENTFTKGFKKGHMLFGRRRAYLKKAALAPFDGVCSGDITVIEAIPGKINPELLPFIIQNNLLFDYAVGNSAGSLSPRVKWESLKGYEFELPELAEQDGLVELLKAAHRTKKAYQKQITATDELVKSQFIEMFGNPITNNMQWPTQPLKKVAPEHTPQIPSMDKYWWLNLDMIESYSGIVIEKVYAERSEIGSSTSTFDDTMVLYSKLRPYLNKVVVPEDFGYATTELVGLKPDSSVLNKYFLFNLLRGDDFVSYANGISGGAQMPRMPVKALREFECILPPMELQEQFVALSEQSDKSKLTSKFNQEVCICLQKPILK